MMNRRKYYDASLMYSFLVVNLIDRSLAIDLATTGAGSEGKVITIAL